MEELKLIRDNYWATKDGRIYSTKRNRYLKQRVGPRGYMMVNLSIEYEMNPFTKGHNLALIADYLVREHAETVGETTNN